MNIASIHSFIETVFYIIAGVAAIAVAFNQVTNHNQLNSDEVIHKYESLLNGYKEERAQLIAAAEKTKADYETQITLLKTQYETRIAALESQVKALQIAKDVLQNTVNGRDILTSLQTILEPVPALFSKGGVIEQFQYNQKIMGQDLQAIKSAIIK